MTEIRVYIVDITDNRADGITINSPIEEFIRERYSNESNNR